MATACIPQLRFEDETFRKPVTVAFDQEYASSDGGLLLLKALDARLGVTATLAGGLRDWRQPGKIQHSVLDLVRQRVFGVALGYADCHDAARLAHDPLHKLALDRDPLSGAALGSQPTLSRFEPSGRSRELGNEIDLIFGYFVHRNVDLFLALGWFIPGRAFPARADNALSAFLALAFTLP